MPIFFRDCVSLSCTTKGRGFLANSQGGGFSARIITVNGVITHEQARTIAEAAEKFGNGEVAFTTRLTVELPGVKYEDIEAFTEFIGKAVWRHLLGQACKGYCLNS